MRIRLRHFVTLLAIATIATSCGTADPDPLAFTEEPTVLTMWTFPGGGHELLIEDFEAQNPGITVDLRESGFDQHHEGLLSAVSADGDVPDVAAVETAYLPRLWHMEDHFLDLLEYGAADLEDNYLDWRWNQSRTPTERIIGLPTDVGGLALAYRRDLFAEAGLPSEPDEVQERIGSWDEFLELGSQFAAATDTSFFLDGPESVFVSRFGQDTAGYLTDDGTIAESSVRAAWDLTVEAIDRDLTGGFRQFSPEWNAAMANGGFASLTAPSWMRSYLSSNASETAGLWGLVSLPGVHGNWGGSALTIPAGAENPDAAWKLIRFLTSESAQFEIFERSGNFPSTPAVYDLPEIAGLADPFFADQVVGPIYIESVLGAPVKSYAPQDREINRSLINTLTDYELGEVTRQEAWDQVGFEVAEILASENE